MAERRKQASPYLEWAVRTGFAYLPGEWFWVLLELDGPVDAFTRTFVRSGLDRFIRIPAAYQGAPPSFSSTGLTCCMALMSREALAAMGAGATRGEARRFASLFSSVNRIELGTPTTNIFEATSPIEPPLLSSQPSRRAIVAVIDDGMAFAHERFRFRNGRSRIKYFWNQDDRTHVRSPGDFGWGRELQQDEINELLAACTHDGLVDEDELYRLAGQDLVARRAKHGTHVMDLACGHDPERAVPNDLPYIIGVQLPKWVTEETSGAFLTPNVYAAISYVLSRADQIAAAEKTGAIPVVINLSYGTIAGPHDGTSQLEEAIEQLVSSRSAPLRVVLPAGNHYLARCHAHVDLPQRLEATPPIEILRWRVQPDDKACSFMECWLPARATMTSRPDIAVRITTPTNERSPWIRGGQSWEWRVSGQTRFLATYDTMVGERSRIFLAMAPTAELRSPPRTAPSGTWLVELKNEGAATTVDAWIQRGDTPLGYPLSGRQSRFDDDHYVRFDLAGRAEQSDDIRSPIRRESTINALATGASPIVVGAYRGSDRRVSEYSAGGGYSAAPGQVPIRSPDLSAIADDSPVHRNLLAAGTRSRSVVAMNGTSVAAPQVTRAIWTLMLAQQNCDRQEMRRRARAGDTKAPLPGSPSATRLGAGRLGANSRRNRT